MSSFNNIYKKTSFLSGVNSAFLEEYYSKYLTNPDSIPSDWKSFFDGLGDEVNVVAKNINGPSWSPKKKTIKIKNIEKLKSEKKKESVEELDFGTLEKAAQDSVRAIMLIRAYRIRGHLIANLDPLGLQKKEEHPELKPETYGFQPKDYNRKIFLDGVLGLKYADLNEILRILKKTYCSNIGYEYMHMGDPDEKGWFRNRIEVQKGHSIY